MKGKGPSRIWHVTYLDVVCVHKVVVCQHEKDYKRIYLQKGIPIKGNVFKNIKMNLKKSYNQWKCLPLLKLSFSAGQRCALL